MSRRDGKFPHVPKLDVDPKVWPEKYWDSCQLCVECEQAWPSSHLFSPSICCEAPTRTAETRPDMRWPEAVKALLAYRFENAYKEYNDGISDEELVVEDATITEAVEQLINESNTPTTTQAPAPVNRWDDANTRRW